MAVPMAAAAAPTLMAQLAPYLPYIGMALSTGAGALGGALSNRGKFKQINRFSPEQNQQLDLLSQLGIGQLQNPYQGFQPIANQARANFQNTTVPMLAERFAGSNARLSSPSYLQQLGAAGSQLDTNLAAMQAQYGQNQQGLAHQLLGLGLQPRFDQAYFGGGDNFLSSLLGGIGRGGAQASMLGLGNQYGLFK